MKNLNKTVKTASFVAGTLAICCALLAMVLSLFCGIGVLFPRKERLTLYTESDRKVYDGLPLTGKDIRITYGTLHDGHELVITSECVYTAVGEYRNAPSYRILDGSGADVTDDYEIRENFGIFTITGRPITVYSPSKSKQYDGRALVSDKITIINGTLSDGHTFIGNADSQIVYPGTMEIQPTFRIVDSTGADMTDQYDVTDELGTLEILPRSITIMTASAEKTYNGTPLSAKEWTHLNGALLEGHELSVVCITEVSDVGSYENQANVRILDQDGSDVSNLYDVSFEYGTLTVSKMSLYISTASATKEYDGVPLVCDSWEIVSGSVGKGETLTLLKPTAADKVGTFENKLQFAIRDENGVDVTHRYDIKQATGTLTVTPKAITVRTGSATKVYDGNELSCETYEIIMGELCEGDELTLATTSIVNIGYTQNYVSGYAIYRTDENGKREDVSGNYRITFDYGTLTVTAG